MEKSNYQPTPMRPEVAELFKRFLMKMDENNNAYTYPIAMNDLGLTFEHLYRIVSTKDKTAPAPKGMAVALMSKEAQNWAGFDRRDPYIGLIRFPNFKHPAERNKSTGAVTKWKTDPIPYTYSQIWYNMASILDPYEKRKKLCELIDEQSALWKE